MHGREDPEKQRARKRANYERNKARILEQNRKWRAAHPEYKKLWNEAHRKELAAYKRKYRAAHLEQERAYQKKWRVAHPNYNREWLKAYRDKQNRRKDNADGEE